MTKQLFRFKSLTLDACFARSYICFFRLRSRVIVIVVFFSSYTPDKASQYNSEIVCSINLIAAFKTIPMLTFPRSIGMNLSPDRSFRCNFSTAWNLYKMLGYLSESIVRLQSATIIWHLYCYPEIQCTDVRPCTTNYIVIFF